MAIISPGLTPVPFNIGAADGCFAKTDKSMGLKYLLGQSDSVNAALQDIAVLLIEDGNALFHSIKEIPGNFRYISEKLFNMTSQKVDVIFSTDMYKENSVKSMERNRRGSSEKLFLKGENTKKPADWKALLTNENTKKQLVQVLLNTWDNDAYVNNLRGRNVVLICEGDAYSYTSEDGITTERTLLDELKSTQEETDSKIILYRLNSHYYKRTNVFIIVDVVVVSVAAAAAAAAANTHDCFRPILFLFFIFRFSH